ncbi:DUF2061 domain-containing protein [Ramlibacter tataouinensis]|uniref:DUF2061 domain-containing protein n=1 Tax=Ramlibacter tataouinensis TaxID=94132 RepID=UPI0022F3B7A1|nr:DUF2061 domain-containing protein [Ramlibacter tataouinensis]WBY02417.1 DUF2061 domain-containing protein [Ramlibacter tataouinensis]
MGTMLLRRIDSSVAKSACFGLIHLAIALGLGWLFTGTFVLAGALALVEPLLNTVAAHNLNKAIDASRLPARRRGLVRGVLLTSSHLVVATGCGWWFTGSLAAGGAYALIEPLVNAVAYHFFDRAWTARVPAIRPASA